MLSVRAKGDKFLISLIPCNATLHGFFAENTSYELVLDTNIPENEKWEIQVTCNDIELEHLARFGEHFFPLDIDYYAGELRLTVHRRGRLITYADLIVDPNKAKLTRDQYASMLRDIATDTLALYRLSQTKVPARTHRTATRLNIATLELIRLHFERLEACIQRIARRPVRRIVRENRSVPVLKVRRVDARAIEKAAGGRRLRTATPDEKSILPDFVNRLEGNWIDAITTRSARESDDTYENRVLLGFLIWLDTRMRRFLEAFSSVCSNEYPEPVRLAWIERLRDYHARLTHLVRNPIFGNIAAELGGVRPTATFRSHPDYAASFTIMRAIKSGVDSQEGSSVSLPIDRTYRLYEIWCYIRLLRALSEEFPAFALTVSELLKEQPDTDRLGVRLLQGAGVSVKLGDNAQLIYQREYNPSGHRNGRPGTLVLPARPDLVIEGFPEVTSDSTSLNAVVIVDPKYRVGPALYEAVRSLHFYRDAIIGSDGRQLVMAALILSPHTLNAKSKRWKDVPLPDRIFFSDFRDAYRLGAVSAVPGSDIETFRELARYLISIMRGNEQINQTENNHFTPASDNTP